MPTKIYLVLIFLFLILLTDAFAKNCQEVRMGFDIGSGSTKMLVAKVDFCKKKILQVLHSESHSVSYNEDLDKNSEGELSPNIIENGKNVLSEMIKVGKTFKPKKSNAVATSVFRKAKNGTKIIKDFSKYFKFSMKVINQEEEASLGYLSAMALKNDSLTKNEDYVVWDIGGGSMQFFHLDKKKNSTIYLGDLAAVNFKNMVVEVLQLKDLQTNTSPNPIGDKREQVLRLARSYAKIHVPAKMKTYLKNNQVIGVGSVHNQSIKNQLDLKEIKYSLSNLDTVSKIQVAKDDESLSGKYKATDVTNLLLVQGFMEALSIKEVELVDASLLQGLILKDSQK